MGLFHVGRTGDVLGPLLGVGDRGVAAVVGAQVLAPLLVDAMHATIDNWRQRAHIDRSAATGLRIASGIGSCIFGLAVRSVPAPTVHAVARERGHAASLGLRCICAGA